MKFWQVSSVKLLKRRPIPCTSKLLVLTKESVQRPVVLIKTETESEVVDSQKSLGDNPSSSKVVNKAASVRRSRRSMSSRSGQSGYVVMKGNSYHGRYWADVPGSERRVRKSVYIGPVEEITKSEAKRQLSKILEQLGVN